MTKRKRLIVLVLVAAIGIATGLWEWLFPRFFNYRPWQPSHPTGVDG